MKTFRLFLILLFCTGIAAGAQTLTLSAKSALPDALTKARNDFSQDAVLENILFANANFGAGALQMDITTGLTSGWLYSFYSPSRDSSVECVAIQLPFPLGMQLLLTPGAGHIFPGGGFHELAEPFLDSPAALQALRQGGAKTFLDAHPEAVVQLAVASYASAGYQQLPEGKYWVFKFNGATDSLTCIIDAVNGTSVLCGYLTALEGIPAATGMRLDQSYPNPVAVGAVSGSVIRYAVAERRAVRLAVFDRLGRELVVLQNGLMDAGEHYAALPAGVIRQPGVYFYRLETSSGFITRKLVVSE